MSDIAIRVEELGKKYHIGRKQIAGATLQDTLTNALSAPFRRAGKLLRGQAYGASGADEVIWALRNVSFEMKAGEVLGIVGNNGAGKSTLLKILSRITEPSDGRAFVYGRVGALLEVGTGFHPELTGRENIYLNAAILGMTRKEIDRKFDEIVAFSEIEKFIDTPIKRYSSGMGLRLGFAVAAHLEPEILVVDEVLAVGDAQFQKKCLGKMSDVANQGRTVLFVSHNMVAVQSLCPRAIWLRQGQLVDDGPTYSIITNYLKESTSVKTECMWENIDSAPGNDRVRFRRVAIRPADESTTPITVHTPLVVEFEYWNLEAGSHLNLSVHVHDDRHATAFHTVSLYDPEWRDRPFPEGLFRSSFYIPGDLLNDGGYTLEVQIVKDHGNLIYRFSDALAFQVQESPTRHESYNWHGKWPGSLRPMFKWTTEQLMITPANTQ